MQILDNMKISLLKSNFGSISSEGVIARKIEQSFDGCTIVMRSTEIICDTSSGKVTSQLRKFDDRDPLHETFLTTIFNTEIRIVRPVERYRHLLGDKITFASVYSNGFAIHFEIK